MNRAKRRIAVIAAGLVLTAVGSLVACGTEGEDVRATQAMMDAPEPGDTTSSTAPAAGETSTTVAGQTTSSTDQTSTTTGGVGFIEGLPAEYQEAFGRRPIVVLFYVPGEVDDEEVLDAVRDLRSTYPTYAFLIYNYKFPDNYGTLASEVGVDYQPFIALIDRHGVLQRKWSGFVDKGTLNQTLIDLGRY